MRDRENTERGVFPNKKVPVPPKDNSSRRSQPSSEPHGTRFPQCVQRDSLPAADVRPKYNGPRQTKPKLVFPRLHATTAMSHGALPLARNGFNTTELRATVTPRAPTMGRAPGRSLRCAAAPVVRLIQAGTSGSMFDLTQCTGQRPKRRDIIPPKPQPPPAATRPKEISRPKRPKTGKHRRDIQNCFPTNTAPREGANHGYPVGGYTDRCDIQNCCPTNTTMGQVIGEREPSRTVPLVPVPPPKPTAPREGANHGYPVGGYTDLRYIIVNTSERVCFNVDNLVSISALLSQPQASFVPQPPQPPPAPQPLQVQYSPKPRLLSKRPQMAPKRKRVDKSTKFPALNQNASMVCAIGAQQRIRTSQNAARIPLKTAWDSNPTHAILSVLRKSQQWAATSQGSSRFGLGDVQDVVFERVISLETLKRNAEESGHRRLITCRRLITLALPSARTFRLRTRQPMDANRVVLQ